MLDILNKNKNTLNQSNCNTVLDYVEKISASASYADDFEFYHHLFHNVTDNKHYLVFRANAFAGHNCNRIVIPFGADFSLIIADKLGISFSWNLPNWPKPLQKRTFTVKYDSITYFNGEKECRIA